MVEIWRYQISIRGYTPLFFLAHQPCSIRFGGMEFEIRWCTDNIGRPEMAFRLAFFFGSCRRVCRWKYVTGLRRDKIVVFDNFAKKIENGW